MRVVGREVAVFLLLSFRDLAVGDGGAARCTRSVQVREVREACSYEYAAVGSEARKFDVN